MSNKEETKTEEIKEEKKPVTIDNLYLELRTAVMNLLINYEKKQISGRVVVGLLLTIISDILNIASTQQVIETLKVREAKNAETSKG